jgi:hypothetical protein
MQHLNRLLCVCALLAVVASAVDKDGAVHTTSAFQGNAANGGTAAHFYQNGKSVLRVSDDFKVPNTPAPTWRVIDSKGVVYTLDAFKIKGGEKRQVVVPAFVPNIAKVQVYCAYAEVVLGEAGFSSPVN